jgi:hypothetical protein
MKKLKKNLFSVSPSVLKKGTVAMLCMVLTSLFLVVRCKKDDKEKPVEYPIDISFTEYSLKETCHWKNLAYDDKVILINSDEELEKYIACTGSGYPTIDFSKHTLLLANGKVEGYVAEIIIKKLQQLSSNEYKLDMEIFNDATIVEEWTIALIVEKISEESRIELNATYEKTDYPLTIRPNRTWYIEHGMLCPEAAGTGCYCYLSTTTIKTGDVKIFNGKEYYELIGSISWGSEIVTYVREEKGRVFFYVKECDKEYLMYDYTLEAGDEVCLIDPQRPFSSNTDNRCELTEKEMNLYKCKVTNVDVIEYDGVKRKRLKVVNEDQRDDFWVEGIGNMRGITYQVTSHITGCHQLKDCYESDKLIFVNENPEYCWFFYK